MVDAVAVYDEDGNVIAVIDLYKRTINYAGKSLPFFLVAGEAEKEYPAYYATEMIKRSIRGSGR